MAPDSAEEEDERRMSRKLFANPKEIAEEGTRIYNTKYRAEFEKKYPAQFVAIDVSSEQAFVALRPDDAVKAAQAASPKAIIHLIRVGSQGAFKVSYSSDASYNWLF